ncbi:MAG: YczE/YyaS/YitT family protein [Sciscionella sp.]
MSAQRTQPRLDPVPVTVEPSRRLPQLFAGLALYGMSNAFMVRAQLGLGPWDVLHQGVSEHTGLSFGTVTALTSLLVLLVWIPLRQRLGFGTVANIVIVAVMVDVTLWLVPVQHTLGPRIALIIGGVLCNGTATACYVGTRLGPGPRDGLMTGISARTGTSIRLVRSCIEITVMLLGLLLGGTIGLGTALYALAIGPLTQLFLPYLAWRGR